jgi:hypothetical protein
MNGYKIIEHCELCGNGFRMGPHAYHGHYIASLKLLLCDRCYKMSWDGFAPRDEKKLLEHCEQNGVPLPPRNSKGFITRPQN